jgi:hypothetical protein
MEENTTPSLEKALAFAELEADKSLKIWVWAKPPRPLPLYAFWPIRSNCNKD